MIIAQQQKHLELQRALLEQQAALTQFQQQQASSNPSPLQALNASLSNLQALNHLASPNVAMGGQMMPSLDLLATLNALNDQAIVNDQLTGLVRHL